MMTLNLQIEPLPQSRPRFSRGRAYEPARITSYKRTIAIAAAAMMAGVEPLTGALRVVMRFGRKFQPTSRRFGDVDNLAKAALDAISGVVFSDDAQVISLAAEKVQSAAPFLEVHVDFDTPATH